MVEFYKPDSIPAYVLRFWRERQLIQDRFMVLTAGPEWFDMMADQHRDGALIAVIRGQGTEASAHESELGNQKSGALKAVLPLLSVTWSLGPRFLGCWWWRHSLPVWKVCGGDLLEDDVSTTDLAALWTAVMGRDPQIQGLWFDHIGGRARSDKIRKSCFRYTGFFVHGVVSGLPHYRLVMPPTWEECRALRSAKSLRRLREKERALCRLLHRDMTLVEMRQVSDLDPHRHTIESLMNATWQAQELGHHLRVSDLEDVARKGWLRSFLLLAGNQGLAFVCGYQGMGVFVYEQVGYDQKFAKFSPGAILLYRLLERLYEHDTPQCVDFGEGEAEYKSLLANQTTCMDGMLVLKQTPVLALLSALSHGLGTIESSLRWVRSRFRLIVRAGAAGRKAAS
jgi:hypothetical protein